MRITVSKAEFDRRKSEALDAAIHPEWQSLAHLAPRLHLDPEHFNQPYCSDPICQRDHRAPDANHERLLLALRVTRPVSTPQPFVEAPSRGKPARSKSGKPVGLGGALTVAWANYVALDASAEDRRGGLCKAHRGPVESDPTAAERQARLDRLALLVRLRSLKKGDR